MLPLLICVYAHSESAFIDCSNRIIELGTKHSIMWCDSRILSREQFFLQKPFQWMLFIDADCFLDADILSYIDGYLIRRFSSIEKKTPLLIAGNYENVKESNYLQRTHNLIANLWLKQFFIDESSDKAFLGGVFLVYHELNQDDLYMRKEIMFGRHIWGGEEQRLARVLQSPPFSFVINRDEKLKVGHLCSSQYLHFFRRAWIHGVNHVKYCCAESKFESKTRFVFSNNFFSRLYYFFTHISSRDLWFVPGVVLHFSVQKAGGLFQKIHQLHSIKWINRSLSMKTQEVRQQQ